MMRIKWFVCVVLFLLLKLPVPAAARPASSPITDEEIKQVCTGGPSPSGAMPLDRMPEIPADKMNAAEKEVASEFAKERGAPPFGPYAPLLHSPEVLLHTQRLMNYLQFKSVLPPKLRQLATAITARQWTQQYMWNVHCPAAVKAGISPDTAKALAEGRRPTGMPEDEEIVYNFIDELHRNQSVSDSTYSKAVAKFGEQGVIDLIALNGGYSYLAMVLNVARHPVNKGATPALPMFPH